MANDDGAKLPQLEHPLTIDVRLTPLRADLLLLFAAVIWGSGFIAQRLATQHLGPLSFTGLRFSLGAVALLPFVVHRRAGEWDRTLLRAGALLGAVMAFGAVFQQWGLATTTAGNGGFITSLYVVIAPFLALAFGERIRRPIWLGVALVLPGLWLLSVDEDSHIRSGDPLVLVGAVGWAFHILLVGRFNGRVDPLRFAFLQFAITGVVALLLGVVVEKPTLEHISAAKWPIVYGGLLPVAVAFSIQMMAQRAAHTAHAAILLSLEAVFALAFGWWLLDETASARQLAGAALMSAGMLAAQLLRPSSAVEPALPSA